MSAICPTQKLTHTFKHLKLVSITELSSQNKLWQNLRNDSICSNHKQKTKTLEQEKDLYSKHSSYTFTRICKKRKLNKLK